MHTDTIEKLTRAGLNLIQQGLSIFDSELRMVVSNRRYQEMFGLPDALVTPGATFQDTISFLVHAGEYGQQSDPEEAVRLRVDTARAFVPHYMERQRSNGRWISVEGSPLGQGGWVTVYTDITEIKHQEQLLRARSEELSGQLLAHAERLSMANRELAATNTALEETKRELTEIEARTRMVTEMMPAHIAHVDRDLIYTYSNRRLSSVMPGSPRDVVGLHSSVALGPVTFARILPHMQRALSGENAVCEVTHEDSGRRIRVALTPDPGTHKNGEQRVGGGIYILSTDITEETQARAALTQTRKRELAAQLTSGLAHDFSNLLTIILGLQGKLSEMPDLPPPAAEAVRATLAATRRGGTLLQRIGDISGARSLRPKPVDLGVLLDDLRMMATASLPDRVRMAIEAPALPGRVLLDPGAVHDSLLNLILNARDAIGNATGMIRLQVRPVRDTWLELTVEDDGPGFSTAALEHGLDPFFTTKGGEGSGLGLAMVFDHASLSGGSVRLDNPQTGGARVTLRLPLRLADETPPSGDTRLVLLVEDSLELRTHVREMLCAMGHQVVEAENASDARTLAQLPEIGFVLSDIQLSDNQSGPALLDELRLARPNLAMGLMTALPVGDTLRQRAEETHEILQKPLDETDLAAFITRCVARTSRIAAQ